ncbi:HDIG domain-containing metalloprotein [uncultured Clostridium sp.]|uniref:HD family phosphohydrolase n=1 Tax=uncultured Clostridium sp. TaxID=59620 RepID=UPI00261DDDB0|nr:HDIG domain-containing metalloprotein [uncultured Clostridium sp.]
MSKAKGILSDTNKILLFVGVFIAIYLILATSLVNKKYDLKSGDIANINIKASREIVDENATQALRKAELAKVNKQYSLSDTVFTNAKTNVNDFFVDVNKIIKQNALNKESATNNQTTAQSDLTNEIKTLSTTYKTFNISNSEYEAILALTPEELTGLQKITLSSLTAAYASPISDPNDTAENTGDIKSYTVKDARIRALEQTESEGINDVLAGIVYKIDLVAIQPNFFYDKTMTEAAINNVEKDVAPVVVKKGQIIVSDGEPVTQNQIALLSELGLLNTSKTNWPIYLSLGALILIVMLMQYIYLYKYHKKVFDNISKLLLISILNVIAILIARVTTIFSPFLIPLAFAPILMTLLTNYKISLVISGLNVLIIAGATNFNPVIILIAVISSVIGAVILRRMQQRNDILIASLIIAIITGVTTLAIGSLTTNNFMEVIVNSGYTVIGGILSGVLAVGILPFFEAAFDIVTTVKLLELSNPNSPLLKKLLMEAPGTYHHSVLVANLAELAAEAIGANALMVRIGAYYHDVGKTKRPYFFKENQIGIENPHNKISDKLSAKIIISHVKDGLEMAREHNLPKDIESFIGTHHGDTLVKYFYINTRNNAENPDDVKEDDFRYPGPKPTTKEQGIVMLSDSVEASVRSIKEHTPESIEKMVNFIIKDKLESGQLNNCDLTLKDIEDIRNCFLKALNGIYHQRIEYPKDEKEK